MQTMQLSDEFDSEQFLNVSWVEDHLLIIVGDSILILSEGFIIVTCVLFALFILVMALREWANNRATDEFYANEDRELRNQREDTWG